MMLRPAHAPAVITTIILGCIGLSGTAHAQTPPGDRELRIYAGLHAAAATGDVKEIERLIAAGERPDIQDARSRTPLHVAVFRKHPEAVRTLLRLGANPNALDDQRFDILTIAAVQNDLDMLKLALDGGASAKNITGPYDGTALSAAAHRGHVDIVRALIAAKAPLDHVNARGWTAVIETVVLGNGSPDHVAIVKALVDAGADVDIRDRRGLTALNYARQRSYTDMVRILEPARGRKT
jgi:ankyrin repeat protein